MADAHNARHLTESDRFGGMVGDWIDQLCDDCGRDGAEAINSMRPRLTLNATVSASATAAIPPPESRTGGSERCRPEHECEDRWQGLAV